jgi:hypothetical protein
MLDRRKDVGVIASEVTVSRSELSPDEPRFFLGIVSNVAHQAPRSLFNFRSYELAIVEFDDQGCCYDRAQMQGLANKLTEFAVQDAIIVVFVHGWKHDARSDDDNLTSFRHVLEETVGQEAQHSASMGSSSTGPRPVLGVFVGWRGMSLYDRFELSENLTFWDRQEAGRRVSVGSVRELFARLRSYRNKRRADGGAPLLVIVGHSFGGMIVYSALAQSLIEAATTPFGEVVPSFADLVLLVNPAVEAARYLPIQTLVDERRKAQQAVEQPPVFVCATAKNDWATGWAFPIGNAFSLLTESCKGPRERQSILNTIGHISWMKTHDLSVDPSANGTGDAAVPVLNPVGGGENGAKSVLGCSGNAGSNQRTQRHFQESFPEIHCEARI